MKAAREDTSVSLPPCHWWGLRQELATLASLVIADAMVAGDACWQEHLVLRFLFMCPRYEGPGRPQGPPSHDHIQRHSGLG